MTKNASVPRAWLENQRLTFSTTPPYIAVLPYAAKNDQTPPVSLYESEGNEISTRKWRFYQSGGVGTDYDQILFNTADYDKTKTYYIDYQSSDRAVLDDLPFADARMLLNVGLFPNQYLYKENLTPADESSVGDFVVPAYVGSFSQVSVTNEDPACGTITSTVGGTGTISFGASNSPTNQYTKYYKLTCTAIGGVDPSETATFKIETWLHSGGNSTGPQVPLGSGVSVKTFTVQADGTGTTSPTNRLLMDGIYLTFSFGASNFAALDTFEWFSYGPAKFEEHSAYSSTNSQFASVGDFSAIGNKNWAANPPTLAANTSQASFEAGASAAYTGEYVRHYQLECTAAAGTAASGSLTFVLASISNNEHFTLSDGIDTVTFEFKKVALGWVAVSGRITIDITAASVDNDVAIAAAAAINLGTNWTHGGYITAATPGGGVANLVNDNNGIGGNVAITAFEANGTTPSTGITPAGMSGGNRTATVVWAGMDELPYTTGSLSLSEATSTSWTDVLLEQGIYLDVVWSAMNATSFVVGDTWGFAARPGRIYYFAKDDRLYTLDVTSASTRTVTGTYAASTIEGGFNTFTVTVGTTGAGGKVTLPDNVLFMARNAGNALNTPTGVNAPNRHVASDQQTFAATCDDTINWAIDQRTTETIASSAIIYDAIGAIQTSTYAGTPGSYYLILDQTPSSIISVKNASTLVNIPYSWLPDTPYIVFSSNPGVNVAVKYQWMGNEPDPGRVYYVTGTRLRSAAEYDTPLLWRDPSEAREGLIPASVDNDLLIGVEIGADAAGNLQEWYTCQVKDYDDDGIYQLSDYKRAVQGTEDRPQISDVCVLNKFSALGSAISSVELCNDMFNFPSKVRMLWVGMPTNSPIGDEDTPDTLIYTSKRTLAVSGTSPSHGCHVLVGNTWATREIVLDDLATKTVTLDGSFIAAALMAKQDAFSDPATTLLYTSLGGVFLDMQEFADAEALALGGANITFCAPIGDGIFRIEEDVTTDPSSIDYLQINAMKQKHWVIRNTTTQMGQKLTGVVPPDPFSAIALIQSYLVELLGNYVAMGMIASYGSELNPPTRRRINPSKDVVIFQDSTVKTDFYYVFFFNLRYPIKRTSGLFGVDSDEVLRGIVKTV
jgi:hypothetical protein